MIIYSDCPHRELLRFLPSAYATAGAGFEILHSKDGACIMTAHAAIAFDPFQNARPCWLPK